MIDKNNYTRSEMPQYYRDLALDCASELNELDDNELLEKLGRSVPFCVCGQEHGGYGGVPIISEKEREGRPPIITAYIAQEECAEKATSIGKYKYIIERDGSK
jgi:hypothetical protein